MTEAEVILICGKICSGKSTYARELCSGVVLSVDDIMLKMFGLHLGDKHDEYARKAQEYLFNLSVELVKHGVTVILDWGFWTKASRDEARKFYASQGISCRIHYLDIDDATWTERMAQRNSSISEGRYNAYPIDDNLLKRFNNLFEAPDQSEIDVLVKADNASHLQRSMKETGRNVLLSHDVIEEFAINQ